MSDSGNNDCNYPDAAWKSLLRARNPDALACIWTKVNQWCYTAVKRYCDDENIAIVAAMASFEKILQRYEQYKLQGAFYSWCRVICVHDVLDKCKRRNKLRDQIDYDALEEPGSDELDPARTVDDDISLEGLQPCLDELKANERQVIDLLYLTKRSSDEEEYGMDPSEVAITMKITQNHTNIIAWRARKKLLLCLKRRGFNNLNDFLAKFS